MKTPFKAKKAQEGRKFVHHKNKRFKPLNKVQVAKAIATLPYSCFPQKKTGKK